MIKYAIKHVPSGMWCDGHDWTGDADLAILFDNYRDAYYHYGSMQAAGLACAPPYEIVPFGLKYAPAGKARPV